MPHYGNPIIVALDMPSAEDAVRMARLVGPHVGGFKVGSVLLQGPGPGVVGVLARLGPVMADAKLHDLPDQVEAAASLLGEYGARWVTAHAAGGHEMLVAAATGLSAGSGGTGGILGETVLSVTDLGADQETYPHRAVQNVAGTDLTFDGTQIVPVPFVFAGLLRLTVSGAVGAQVGSVIVFVEESGRGVGW